MLLGEVATHLTRNQLISYSLLEFRPSVTTPAISRLLYNKLIEKTKHGAQYEHTLTALGKEHLKLLKERKDIHFGSIYTV